jgi:ribonucrease Y
MIEVLCIVAALLVGLGVGWLFAAGRGKQVVTEARAGADGVTAEAQKNVAVILAEAESKSRAEASELLEGVDEQARQIVEDNKRTEDRLEKIKKLQEGREKVLTEREATVEKRQEAIDEIRTEAKALRQQAKDARKAQRATLEERAEQTGDELKGILVESAVEQTRSECADRLRNLENEQTDELNKEAKRVMDLIMQRYTGHCVRDRGSSVIPLSNGMESVLNSNPENLNILTEITGVNIIPTEGDEGLRLDTGNGVGREICKRVIARFMDEKSIRNPEALVNSVTSDLEKEIQETGRKAFKVLKIKKAEPEISELVGKLNFRTSYTQNQWRHAVEAAHLAGMMAGELGLEAKVAVRGALLHDIGKALTHEVEGSHALIGAELARKHGETAVVANAIGYHHGEEPLESAYAPLVAAADALSGGRPGARREAVDTYGDRIEELEHIASGFKGVTQVYAVQGGREIRVRVNNERVNEASLAELSQEIALKISDEMVFPGQIRVTVIREFCATEFAN